MASDMPSKIDVHVHFLPPAYRQACLDHGHANPDGMPYLPEWSEEAHLELMDKNGIQKAILSISTPGTHLVYNDSELAATVTRDCNSYAADLKKRMPERFGYWASLPIPDVDLCLEEIAKSAEEGCDGYALLTNGHGHYLGDPIFDPATVQQSVQGTGSRPSRTRTVCSMLLWRLPRAMPPSRQAQAY